MHLGELGCIATEIFAGRLRLGRTGQLLNHLDPRSAPTASAVDDSQHGQPGGYPLAPSPASVPPLLGVADSGVAARRARASNTSNDTSAADGSTADAAPRLLLSVDGSHLRLVARPPEHAVEHTDRGRERRREPRVALLGREAVEDHAELDQKA